MNSNPTHAQVYSRHLSMITVYRWLVAGRGFPRIPQPIIVTPTLTLDCLALVDSCCIYIFTEMSSRRVYYKKQVFGRVRVAHLISFSVLYFLHCLCSTIVSELSIHDCPFGLSVSLGCPFLTTPSVFLKVYFRPSRIRRWTLLRPTLSFFSENATSPFYNSMATILLCRESQTSDNWNNLFAWYVQEINRQKISTSILYLKLMYVFKIIRYNIPR